MTVEKTISNFVKTQFPDFYQEEGPAFINFCTAYYEWMEVTGQATYQSRKLEDYLDIDTTPEDFIIYFKEKYLKNIQFELTSNKKLAVKHSLDLYRSKGTERSVDLFFKLIYGTDAFVSYPSENIFRLSSGAWTRPTYIEVADAPNLVEYVGKQIFGSLSDSSAFVEKYIKRKTKRGYVNIFYVSNITGDFQSNESLLYSNIASIPCTIIGSLNAIQIIDGGKEFSVGEIVNVIGASGVNAKARVTAIETATGEVDFTFIDGGAGYTTSPQVLIANNTLIVSNVASNSDSYFNTFEVISQSLANIAFSNSATTITTNSILHSGNNYGRVISVNQTGNTGTLVLSVSNGSFISTSNLYNSSNTFVAYVNTANNTTASAQILRRSPQVTIETQFTPSPAIEVFDVAYQKTGNTVYATGIVQLSVDRSLILRDVVGVFKKDDILYFENSTFTSPVASISVFLDVFAVNGNFTSENAPYVNSLTANGVLSSITGGDSANFSIASVSNSETLFLNTDIITANLLATSLGANSYGLPKNPSGNISSTLSSCLTYNVFNIGTIQDITGINPGENYENSPGVLVYQPYVTAFEKHDYILEVVNATSNFLSGEFIQQTYSGNNYLIGMANTSAFIEGDAVYQGNTYGQVKQVVSNNFILVYEAAGVFVPGSNVLSYTSNTSINAANVTAIPFTDYVIGKVNQANSSVLHVERELFKHDFIPGSVIVGLSSNTYATVSNVSEDANSQIMGLNADIDSSVFQSNGIIKTVSLVDSGFAYYDNTAILLSTDKTRSAVGSVINSSYGTGSGYYKTSDGFLSADKFLYDGDFYQEYSYEVFSKLPFQKYSEMLKKVMHVAGTKLFGAVQINSTINTMSGNPISQITQV